MFEIEGKYNKAKVFATTVENECISQITDLCNQKWLEGCDIAIMPDCHAGKGCTIGTTIKLKDKVCPSLVGVDIGCGMLAIEIPTQFSLNLEHIDDFIVNHIPNGFSVNEKIIYHRKDFNLKNLRCYKQLKNVEYLKKSVGSLGGGNHFIEVNQTFLGKKCLVIHTGSRNLGKQVAEYYQNVADEYCNHSIKNHQESRKSLISQLKAEGRLKEINEKLKEFDANYQHTQKIPHDLCYLEGRDAQNYLHDVELCSQFASMNRIHIAQRILSFIAIDNGFDKDTTQVLITYDSPHSFKVAILDRDNRIFTTLGFETIHNYIGADNILRKGAISANIGEKVIIPINMRDGSIIGIGKGNPSYNFSGPHGAGRLMSRSSAKEKVNFKEYQKSMEGIYSSSVCQSTMDESPMVYKSIDEIIDNICESVELVDIIKPIYNFKAH